MPVDSRVFRSDLHPGVAFEVSHDPESDRWSVTRRRESGGVEEVLDETDARFPPRPLTHERVFQWALEHGETRASTEANELDSALDADLTSPDFLDSV